MLTRTTPGCDTVSITALPSVTAATTEALPTASATSTTTEPRRRRLTLREQGYVARVRQSEHYRDEHPLPATMGELHAAIDVAGIDNLRLLPRHALAIAECGLPERMPTRGGQYYRRKISEAARAAMFDLCKAILSDVDKLAPEQAEELLRPVTKAIARAGGWRLDTVEDTARTAAGCGKRYSPIPEEKQDQLLDAFEQAKLRMGVPS